MERIVRNRWKRLLINKAYFNKIPGIEGISHLRKG
jgi:hypothetical protein